MPDYTSPFRPASAALEYAPAARRRRKWMARAAVLLLVLAMGYGSYRWGSFAWKQARILYWQRQCLAYSPGGEEVAYEEDPSAAARLLARNPEFASYSLARYSLKRGVRLGTGAPVNAAARVPACWSRFGALNGIPIAGRNYGAVVFLHERVSPAGNRRLVCVRYFPESETFTSGFIEGYNFEPEVFTPATLTRPPTSIPKGFAIDVISGWPRHAPRVRMFAGQPDPGDASHFTVRYQMWGKEDVLDGKLDDNNNVTLTPRRLPQDD